MVLPLVDAELEVAGRAGWGGLVSHPVFGRASTARSTRAPSSASTAASNVLYGPREDSASSVSYKNAAIVSAKKYKKKDLMKLKKNWNWKNWIEKIEKNWNLKNWIEIEKNWNCTPQGAIGTQVLLTKKVKLFAGFLLVSQKPKLFVSSEAQSGNWYGNEIILLLKSFHVAMINDLFLKFPFQTFVIELFPINFFQEFIRELKK